MTETGTQDERQKEGSSGVDRSKSREYIRGSEIAKVIKYSDDEAQEHFVDASCSRTIAMDV